MPDVQDKAKQHLFGGAWEPSKPPSLIGPDNYCELRNVRYGDPSLKGVLGYTRINEDVLPDEFTMIRNGFQLRTANGDEYIFVQAWNAGLTASKVFVMQAAAPVPAEFTAVAVHTDAAGAGVGRFSEVAGGQMVYSNGVETLIWAGDKFRCAAVFVVKDSSLTSPKDRTEAANNTLVGSKDLIALNAATYPIMLVFSTRPLQGIGLSVETANSTASTLSAKYWSGTAWTDASGLSDGTTSAGVALAQDGDVSWTSTVGTAKPKHFEGLYFYAYMITLSAGSASISHVTTDMPMQPLVDVWDGVYRTCTQFQASRSSKYEDYTLEVNEESSVYYPICALIGGLTSSDHLILQFPERMSGFRVKMNADNRNATASVMTVKYWDGDSFEAVTGLSDGTAVGGATLGQTGVVSWNPPDEGSEHAQHLFGSTGYCYKLTFSGTLTADTENDGTSVDLVNGIPAQLSVPAYTFAADYKGALMLFDRPDSTERNRLDYSMPNAPDVFNGDLSSMLGEQTMYVGGAAELRGAVSIFNRFGSNIYDTLLALKDSETHLLNGESPENYQLYTISKTVGCPAPLTLVAAEAGFELTEGVTRNVAMWLSFSGPYMFDGAVLYPLKGLEIYFDPSETDKCVNFGAIANARGWYDALYKEYNLLLPTAQSTECDLWVVYDLVRKKWLRKDPVATGALMLQCGFTVLDNHGRRHCYGGVDTGRLLRLDYGTSFDGAYIWQICETGDFWPDNNVYMETLLRHMKIIARKISEEHTLSVIHIPNTVDSGLPWFEDSEESWFEDSEDSWFTTVPGEQIRLSLGLDGTAGVIAEGNQELNLQARSHRFRFSLKTKDTPMGFQPIAFGYLYQEVRVSR
ncbi:MAG: hypothetical protein KKE73_10935 [Proteobacteria bacterium]|nr:hypothetical protein [Pseudomonadota bacterium]